MLEFGYGFRQLPSHVGAAFLSEDSEPFSLVHNVGELLNAVVPRPIEVVVHYQCCLRVPPWRDTLKRLQETSHAKSAIHQNQVEVQIGSCMLARVVGVPAPAG